MQTDQTNQTSRTARRRPMCGGVIGQLNQEWQTSLGQRRPPSGWAAASPALATAATLQELLETVSDGDRAVTDAVLYSLLSLHAAGDETAGRTVLQTMLGKVARMARTVYKRGVQDAHEVALEAMWATIQNYPLHRTSSVAGNLALDALHRLQRPTHLEVPVDGERLENLEMTALEEGRPSHEQHLDFDDTLTAALRWAGDHDVLTAHEIKILARVNLTTWGATVPKPMAAVASELGISYPTLRQRHSRAVRRLAQAVAARMDPPVC